MPARFLAELATPEVVAAQERYAGRASPRVPAESRDRLGATEAEFISERDSFYMASVSSNGWPYVQHRGGPAGFVKVIDEHTLAFPDFRGNRQLISTGNLAGDGRVALILVDYPSRTRLKVLGYARIVGATEDPSLASRLGATELGRKVERLVTIDVVAFDWNCPAYITPRYTVAQIEKLVAPLKRRISELEAEIAERSRQSA
jgi:predicted pyridoxine 5'-phosphate oxidase superfamily flavin-nucleotide-binding protein